MGSLNFPDLVTLLFTAFSLGAWTSTAPTASANVASYFIYRRDPFALLTGTLRTYQKAACDDEWMSLRCPFSTTISVQLAQYGRTAPSPALCTSNSNSHPDLIDLSDPHNNVTCQWPPAIQTVVGLCQKKASCKFQTSPRTFGGDPCPGSRKYVEVAYKCRPSEFRSVIGCENDVIQLKCNRSSRLAIYSANYGRTEYESVQCPQPKGVHEESCLSSYATETAMQMCHGKRKCALGVDPATFGTPCKPESKMYLKIVHTCVPRKVLKEKYQGEPEPDEMFDEEAEYETGDSVGGVVEQPSIYSPDHSKGWANPKSTAKPKISSSSQSAGNSERFYLYVAISVSSALLIVVLVILAKIGIQRRHPRAGNSSSAENNCTSSKPSSSSVGPITSALSDIDELSVVMDSNDVTELPSILRRSPGDDLGTNTNTTSVMMPSCTTTTSMMLKPSNATNTMTLGRNNEVVRFSNSRGVPNTPSANTTSTNPRSLNRDSSANIHFYYD